MLEEPSKNCEPMSSFCMFYTRAASVCFTQAVFHAEFTKGILTVWQQRRSLSRRRSLRQCAGSENAHSLAPNLNCTELAMRDSVLIVASLTMCQLVLQPQRCILHWEDADPADLRPP